MPTLSTSLGLSNRYIQAKLIELNKRSAVTKQLLNKVPLSPGDGKTANMETYGRIAVPTTTLSEGVTPAETPFSAASQSVTVDHYGLFVAMTDVGMVTPKHPALERALFLVGDAITRLEEYTNVDAMTVGGTNVQYWNGTRANRGAITATDTWQDAIATKIVAYFRQQGADPSRGMLFTALTSPAIIGDISANPTAVASLQAALNGSNDIKELRNGDVGVWRGAAWMWSNMLPQWTRATLITPTATTGGSLSGTVYTKVTRISTQDGFEDEVAVEASTAMGANTRLQFTAPSTAGYVYRIYAGSATGDANLFLAKDSLNPSETYNLDTIPTSGRVPPATPAANVTVHPIYFTALNFGDVVTLDKLNLRPTITPPGESDSDPLGQRRKVGAKTALKMGVRDQTRLYRVELASNN